MVKSTSSQTDNHQNGEISEASPNTKDKRSMVFSLSSLARLDVPERQNTRAGYGNGELSPQAFSVGLTDGTPGGTSGSFRTDADISGGASGSFRTDAAISGNQAMRERNLQRWEAPAANRVDMSLESSASAGGEWDQFKANEQKFGLKSDYDENIYTTRIDRSNPLYAMREREAARIAREIEGDVSSNPHVREERGHGDEALDEEAKYVLLPLVLANITDNLQVQRSRSQCPGLPALGLQPGWPICRASTPTTRNKLYQRCLRRSRYNLFAGCATRFHESEAGSNCREVRTEERGEGRATGGS